MTKEIVLNLSEKVREVARLQGLILSERQADKSAREVMYSLNGRGLDAWAWDAVVNAVQGTPKWEKYLEAKRASLPDMEPVVLDDLAGQEKALVIRPAMTPGNLLVQSMYLPLKVVLRTVEFTPDFMRQVVEFLGDGRRSGTCVVPTSPSTLLINLESPLSVSVGFVRDGEEPDRVILGYENLEKLKGTFRELSAPGSKKEGSL